MKQVYLALSAALLLVVMASCHKEKEFISAATISTLNNPTPQQEVLCGLLENKAKTEAAKAAFHRLATSNEPYVIYLIFEGYRVLDPNWNNGQPFNCPKSGLTQAQKKDILARVKEKYSLFDKVIVTDNVNDCSNVAADRLVRCIVTKNIGAFIGGDYPGIAWLSSYAWVPASANAIPPCFIQVQLYGNVADMATSAAHESAHVFGRPHAHLYDQNGNVAGEYSIGWGNPGEFLSGGDIMGNAYNRTFANWTDEDIASLGAILGFKNDTYGDTFADAYQIFSSNGTQRAWKEILGDNDVADVAFLKKVSGKKPKITLTSAGSCLLQLDVYKKVNQNMVLVASLFSESSLSIQKTLPSGVDYYLVVTRHPINRYDFWGQPLSPTFGAGAWNGEISFVN